MFILIIKKRKKGRWAMNYGKLFLVLILCAYGISGTYNIHMCGSFKPMKIDHPLVNIMDGSPRINIAQLLFLEKNIKQLLVGIELKAPIEYRGARYNIT